MGKQSQSYLCQLLNKDRTGHRVVLFVSFVNLRSAEDMGHSVWSLVNCRWVETLQLYTCFGKPMASAISIRERLDCALGVERWRE